MNNTNPINTVINFRIPASLKRDFHLSCDMRNQSASFVLRRLIEGYVKGRYALEKEPHD